MPEAADEFYRNAKSHIDQLASEVPDGVASVNFSSVLSGVISIVNATIPEAAVAKALVSAAVSVFVGGFEQSVNARARAEHNTALSHLDAYANATALEIMERTRAMVNHIETGLDDVVAQAMADAGDGIYDDAAWYDGMCDYMGLADPIPYAEALRQRLEYDFIGVWATTKAELLEARGLEANPHLWGLEAQREERGLYGEEGEQAWKDAYDESDVNHHHPGHVQHQGSDHHEGTSGASVDMGDPTVTEVESS